MQKQISVYQKTREGVVNCNENDCKKTIGQHHRFGQHFFGNPNLSTP